VTLVFAATPALWSNLSYVLGMYVAMSALGQIMFVSFIASAMAICWPPVATSQFAIYMSLSNLARSLGAGLFAATADWLGASGPFYAMAALLALALAALSRLDLGAHAERLRALDARAAPPA
jgi:hypothetical protein